MIEYFDDPERTAFTDGRFRTGNLDRRDGEGNFYVVARRKDIIRVRGENVCGAEVDRVLLPHPDVELAAAVGVPGEMGDEDVLGAVKLRGGADVLPEQLKAWCAGPLAAVKVPRYVLLTDQLPLTSTHKVQKLELRKTVL